MRGHFLNVPKFRGVIICEPTEPMGSPKFSERLLLNIRILEKYGISIYVYLHDPWELRITYKNLEFTPLKSVFPELYCTNHAWVLCFIIPHNSVL